MESPENQHTCWTTFFANTRPARAAWGQFATGGFIGFLLTECAKAWFGSEVPAKTTATVALALGGVFGLIELGDQCTNPQRHYTPIAPENV